MEGAMPRTFDIVALCGSLRACSTNRALLEAARRLAPPEMAIAPTLDGSLVPHFNSDFDGDPPASVAAASWRSRIARCDGLIISSPEYASGIPGSLKNALDWLVGDAGFSGKPVAIFAASTRSCASAAALRLVLQTMAADLVEDACAAFPLLGSTPQAMDLCADAGISGRLGAALLAFQAHLEKRSIERP